MNPNQAAQILRNLLNVPAVKLVLHSADIAAGEQALQALHAAALRAPAPPKPAATPTPAPDAPPA